MFSPAPDLRSEKRVFALSRPLLLLLAAGLPLFLSFSWNSDPLAPKQALWTVAGALLLVLPFPLDISRAGPAAALAAMAAFASPTAPPSAVPLLPWLIGMAVWFRAREAAATRKFIPEYSRLTVLVAALVAANGISQAAWNSLFSTVRLDNPFGQRVLGTLGNPTFLADYLALHLPLALALSAASPGAGSFALWSSCSGAIAMALTLSGSKGGQLAAAVAGAAWFAFALRHGKIARGRLAALAATIAIVALGAGLIPLFESSPSGAFGRWTSGAERFSFRQRREILLSSARLLARSPVLGHGPGAYPVLIPPFQTDALNRSIGITLSVNHAHDDYAEAGCDLGTAGLGLVLLVMVAGWRRGPEQALRSGLVCSMLAIAASMAVNFFLFLPSSAFFFWMHAGLLAPAAAPNSSAGLAPGAGAAGKAPCRAAVWLLAAYLCLSGGRHLAATGWISRGISALDRGGLNAAAFDLKRAVTLAPANRQAFQYLGRAYEQGGDLAESEAAYRTAWKLGPHLAITSLNVGRVLRRRYLTAGDRESRDRAIGMLLLTVRANPWQVEPRVWGAELSLDAGRTKDCEDFFLTPSGFGPTAAFYRVRARYETAARNSARAGRFSRMADLREADDAFAQGRRNEAISMARKITERNPGFSDGWLSLGVFMYESGRLKQAKACFEKLARIEPGSVLASLNLGTIAVAERRAGAARRHLAKLERTAPESLDVRLLRARVLELEGKSEEAIKEYEWILERHPDHPQAKAELQRLRGR